jgi:hypothetical protein
LDPSAVAAIKDILEMVLLVMILMNALMQLVTTAVQMLCVTTYLDHSHVCARLVSLEMVKHAQILMNVLPLLTTEVLMLPVQIPLVASCANVKMAILGME